MIYMFEYEDRDSDTGFTTKRFTAKNLEDAERKAAYHFGSRRGYVREATPEEIRKIRREIARYWASFPDLLRSIDWPEEDIPRMVGAHERRLASGKEAKQQAKKKAHLAIVRQRRIERSIERKVNTACKKLKELAPSMSDEEIKPYADAYREKLRAESVPTGASVDAENKKPA